MASSVLTHSFYHLNLSVVLITCAHLLPYNSAFIISSSTTSLSLHLILLFAQSQHLIIAHHHCFVLASKSRFLTMAPPLSEYNDTQYSSGLNQIQDLINSFHQHCKEYAHPCEDCLAAMLRDIAILLALLMNFGPSKHLVDEYANLSRLDRMSKQLLVIDTKAVCKDIWVLIDRKLRALEDTPFAQPPPRVSYSERVTDEAAWEEEGQFDEVGRRVSDDGDDTSPFQFGDTPIEVIWRPQTDVDARVPVEEHQVDEMALTPDLLSRISDSLAGYISQLSTTDDSPQVSDAPVPGRPSEDQTTTNAASVSTLDFAEGEPRSAFSDTTASSSRTVTPQPSSASQSAAVSDIIIERPPRTYSPIPPGPSQPSTSQPSSVSLSTVSDIIERQPTFTLSSSLDPQELQEFLDPDWTLALPRTAEEQWIAEGRPATVRVYPRSGRSSRFLEDMRA